MPLILLFAQAAAAQSAGRVAPDARAPSEIVAAAPAGDWVDIAAADLLVMELAPDRDGPSTRSGPRRVVIQLMPPPFSQGWVGNIRKLAAAHWWDGTSVNRVQDNYVVQWGDATEKKPLPVGLQATDLNAVYLSQVPLALLKAAGAEQVPDSPKTNWRSPMLRRDAYSDYASFIGGFPFAGTTHTDYVSAWPVHCYGMVGVGRDMPPNAGNGTELYSVIGHAPRHLDRNIALVGRVIEGIENLSSLPRGTEALGFYKTPGERTAIRSIRLASELPAAERPHFQYLSTESASFARYADARANRRDPFFNVPAGGADICNIPVPVRRAK